MLLNTGRKRFSESLSNRVGGTSGLKSRGPWPGVRLRNESAIHRFCPRPVLRRDDSTVSILLGCDLNRRRTHFSSEKII